MWGAVVFAELISPAPKEITGLVSPLAQPGLSGFSSFMLDQGFFLIPLLLLIALGSLVRRWRASSGVERLQYPWLMTAIGFVIVILVTTQVVPESVILDVSLVLIALNAIPAAIGVAILRYRLYDIDKLISRTVSYALVAAVLVGVYVGSALALGALVGRGNPLAVAGATLAAAALFTPLRRRVQEFVERRFDRSRYDAGHGGGRLSSRLRQEVDLDGLTTDLTAVVGQTLRPVSVSLWLKGIATMIRRWLGVVMGLASLSVIVYGQTQSPQVRELVSSTSWGSWRSPLQAPSVLIWCGGSRPILWEDWILAGGLAFTVGHRRRHCPDRWPFAAGEPGSGPGNGPFPWL